MEHVLAVYAEAYDPARPVVCLDERPCTLRAEARPGEPMRPATLGRHGRDARHDPEYVRRGTCSLFCAFEPLAATRHTWALERRRRVEFAAVVRELVDVHYSEAECVRIVCDNLNTHSAASFYAAFPAAEARRIAERIEFIYTPVHGSWLNMVECEFAVFVRECLSNGRRRIATVEKLEREAAAWAARRNEYGGTVNWSMTTEDARVKLGRLYPTIVS